MNPKFDVAIVGAGFAGIACVIALVRRNPALNIVLLDPAAELPAGLPFAGARPEHLLNVRADQMSLDCAQPLHFCDYLARLWGESSAALREVFAPRAVYADYLRVHFIQAQQAAAPGNGQVTHISAKVRQIQHSEGGYAIFTSASDARNPLQLQALQVILALGAGHFTALIEHPRWHLGPWHLTKLPVHSSSDTALIIGSGLTGVDSAQTLQQLGWRGAIKMLSPNARLPAAHAAHALPTWILADNFVEQVRTPRLFLRALRAEMVRARALGIDWRPVVNALRPITTQIFSSWTPVERIKMLKRGSSLWRSHRNRMPPLAAHVMEALEISGQLSRVYGRFTAVRANSDSALLISTSVHANADANALQNMDEYALVIDARGPNYRCQESPLAQALINNGLIKTSATGFGLDADIDGRVGDQIYTLGALAFGERLETTAVPEIRQQAERIAELIVTRLNTRELPLIKGD